MSAATICHRACAIVRIKNAAAIAAATRAVNPNNAECHVGMRIVPQLLAVAPRVKCAVSLRDNDEAQARGVGQFCACRALQSWYLPFSAQ